MMKLEIEFIQADLSHLHLLVESRIDFLSEYWGKQPAESVENLRHNLTNFFRTEIPAKTYICWFAMIGREYAGVGGMKYINKPGSFRLPDGRTGYIMNMFTRPEYRGQGLASKILDLLIDSGRKEGVQLFELNATDEGKPLYLKSGFEIHKEPTMRKFVKDK